MGLLSKLFGGAGQSVTGRFETLIPKRSQSGYVFLDANNDLAMSASIISTFSPENMMAYGYTRRSIAAACLNQGLCDKKTYLQTAVLFKALQVQTGQTIEFQRQAAEDAIFFLATYDKRMDKTTMRALHALSENMQVDMIQGPITDDQLFKSLSLGMA